MKTKLIKILNNKKFYYWLFTVGTLIVAYVLYSGYAALNAVFAQPVKPSPYIEIKANESPGLKWGKEMAQFAPVENWKVDKDYKPDTVIADDKCAELTKGSLSTFKAGNDDVKVRVSIYSAGMAAIDYKTQLPILEKCLGTKANLKETGYPLIADNTFVFTLGDGVISVTAHKQDINKLYKMYLDKAKNSLNNSGCKLVETDLNASAGRNLFIQPDNYKGLIFTQSVATQLDIKHLPLPIVEPISEPSKVDVVKPETPLPADFPDKMPDVVERPKLPKVVEVKDKLAEDAHYQVVDNEGPGCGWSWSGLQQPTYDLELLAKNKATEISKTQISVDGHAKEYLATYRQYIDQMFLIAPQIRAYNDYVIQSEKVKERWSWLNTQRELIKQDYTTYVEAHNKWFNFDKDKEKASQDYFKALKDCDDKLTAFNNWNGIGSKPEICKELPKRPEILDQQKGEEPQAPKIPAGVTIPDSWEKPQR